MDDHRYFSKDELVHLVHVLNRKLQAALDREDRELREKINVTKERDALLEEVRRLNAAKDRG